MRPLRSLLFVPGHRGTWVEKAVASDADAVILDLEDSVPAHLKEQARQEVVRSAARLRAAGSPVAVYVRLNSLESGLPGDDLEVVAVEGVDGFMLPKTYGVEDVVRFDGLVTHFERRNGVAPQTFEFIVSLETAEAYADCDNIARAPRVVTLFAGVARDGDVSRSIGFQFTPGGLETIYLRSRALLATRAAGLEFPLCGLWQDLSDKEGARAFALQNRDLGFRGQVLIHPSHVELVNGIYSPSASEIEFYDGMIKAFEAAVGDGAAAITYEGMHVDYAHVKTAREILDYSRRLTENVARQTDTAPSADRSPAGRVSQDAQTSV
ncbi:HpcH/HpaI aldolase/citrate lyase family protein [Rhodococcus opacus]|uniref:HpcH/HpaI aldolase/citrate lyase family protein n=1 Tax=Rhodococcus opacus TaxID=37919 RepID=UPI00146CC731|nr:CoA ester lyase [Rhodococcus opacus]MDV7088956.1 CoA ester lyase [Rhodococcus opacus]